MDSGKASVLGCRIDRLTLGETVSRCIEVIEAGRPAQQMSINAAKMVAVRKDHRLRAIAEACALVSADGQPVVWASRLLRDPLPERVAGIDLMNELLEVAAQRGYKVFVLGARPEILKRAIERLEERLPTLRVVGAHHGYFSTEEEPGVCSAIRAAAPEILLVAMSSPRKEYFLADHSAELEVPLSIGVGGSIDVVAGATRRAPAWMQKTGLEWLFRMLQEPRRLGWRYVQTNTQFGLLLGRELLKHHQELSPDRSEGAA